MSEQYWIIDDQGKKFCSCQRFDDGTLILDNKKGKITMTNFMYQAYGHHFDPGKRKKSLRKSAE